MDKNVLCGVGRKSTVLLLLIIFCLFNTALLFRAAVNTLYFMEDPGKDYTEITATVLELPVQKGASGESDNMITPLFSFAYKGKNMTREAPALQYVQDMNSTPPYRIGEEVSLWIHDYRGEIIQAPTLSRDDIGRSQLVVSALSLVLALVLWKVRNMLARHKQCKNHSI